MAPETYVVTAIISFQGAFFISSFWRTGVHLFPQHINEPVTFFKVSWFNFDFDGKCIMSRRRTDHFTIVCSVTWPLDASEAAGDLVLIQTSLILFCKSSCSNANQFVLNEESREVCIKARPPPASLAFIGQGTKHTNAKWPIQDQRKYFQS